ncbi:MAG: hypothetical protein GY749_29870 [Desulfobacteraceae bacterium]|nr:hypothetical protein [Desulfobacteraceae bacterium]
MINIDRKTFESFIPIFEFAIDKLNGSDKRIYLAKISQALGYGGQTIVCQTFGIDPKTLKKGVQEIVSGFNIVDAFNLRGRNNIENQLHNFLEDIKDIVDCSSQVDPKFKGKRLYTRLTPEEIKCQLHESKGYKLSELPTARTVYNKLVKMGYSFTKVQKIRPKKKIAETDAIFKKNKTD